MIYGYMRVSTDDQTHDSQVESINRYNPDKVFSDKITGSAKSRPALDSLLETLKPGDTVVVYRLDRLGRSILHLAEMIEHFKQHEITFISASEAIDTSQPSGILLFGVLASVAEFEKASISQRTKAGLAAARAKGTRLGQKPKLTPNQQNEVKSLYPEKSIRELASLYGVGKSTIHNIVRTVH